MGGSVTLAPMSLQPRQKSSSIALDAERIKSCVSVQAPDVIDVLQKTASTNSYLLERPIFRQRAQVCLAEAQTAGRGRHGNQWVSTPNRNIMLSLSWGFHGWPNDVAALRLAVGLGITMMLNDEFDIDATIKWPNDILVNDAKLAGILIDVAGHSKSDCQVVVGVGLNVDQADWDDGLEYLWCDLRGLGVVVDRNVLVAKLIDVVVLVLRNFESNGFASMVTSWNKLSAFTGRKVQVIQSSESVVGFMVGVETDGALLIKDSEGQCHRVSDSRASLRVISDDEAIS